MKYKVWLKYKGQEVIIVDSDTTENAEQHAVEIFFNQIVGDIDPEIVDVEVYEIG